MKKEDTNYTTDYNKMKSLGIVYSNSGTLSEKYWLASRVIRKGSNNVHFGIRTTGTTLDDVGRGEVGGVSEGGANNNYKPIAGRR